MLGRETRLSINLHFRFLNLILWILQIHTETTSQVFCWMGFFISLHLPSMFALSSLLFLIFSTLFSSKNNGVV